MLAIVFVYNLIILGLVFGIFLSEIFPQHHFLIGGLLGLIVLGFLVLATRSPVGEFLLRLQTGARKAIGREEKRIRPLLDELCKRANIREPLMIYVYDTQEINAYAFTRKSIGVTRGLLESCSDDELMGVLAHELGHIQNGDTDRRALALVIGSISNLFSSFVFGMVMGMMIGNRVALYFRNPFIFVVSLVLALLFFWVFILALLGRFMMDIGLRTVGRIEEYKADAYAVQLGAGKGLLRFLERLSTTVMEGKQTFWQRLQATHPPTMERIDALDRLLSREVSV
ncbi:M48 family metalloprotease [Brevibacillus marinus]|uniref:M48 family metalloprotease n=1 Tax=Brevibacillus marinus TaxID=2496837 RepID=UPI0013DEEC97|nr:M48 family metalloprotease [Brevibacillus marinus]